MIEIKVEDLSSFAPKPGDVLLVRAPGISAYEAHEIQKRVRAYFPNNEVIVHDPATEISPLSLKPSDKLLLRCDGKLDLSQAKLIKFRLSRAFPYNEIVMISAHAQVATGQVPEIVKVPKVALVELVALLVRNLRPEEGDGRRAAAEMLDRLVEANRGVVAALEETQG